MVHWDWRHLCSTRTKVQSPAWQSGLRIQHWVQLWLRPDPWPGNLHMLWSAPPPPKKRKKKERVQGKYMVLASLQILTAPLPCMAHLTLANGPGRPVCTLQQPPLPTVTPPAGREGTTGAKLGSSEGG